MPPPPPLNREYPAGSTVAFSGSGEELNKNNSYPHKAGFAQPSGLAIADNGFMYVADSESSTVRAVKLDSGAVQACVGGALDPSVRAMHNFVLQMFPATWYACSVFRYFICVCVCKSMYITYIMCCDIMYIYTYIHIYTYI